MVARTPGLTDRAKPYSSAGCSSGAGGGGTTRPLGERHEGPEKPGGATGKGRTIATCGHFQPETGEKWWLNPGKNEELDMTEASKNVWFSQEKAGSGMEKADASTENMAFDSSKFAWGPNMA